MLRTSSARQTVSRTSRISSPRLRGRRNHILPNAGIEELASLRDEDYRVAKKSVVYR